MNSINKSLFISIFLVLNLLSTLNSFAEANNFSFVENKGQLESDVLFFAQLKNQNILITKTGFSYDNFEINNTFSKHHRVDIKFINQNNKNSIQKSSPSISFENHYINGKTILNVKKYSFVIISNIFNGVDIKYSFDDNGNFKYDYIIHPDGDINNIRFKILGATSSLKKNAINIETSLGLLVEKIPRSFLEENGKNINVFYKSLGDNIFGFKTENFDATKTLVIDPSPNLSWGTYHGGTGTDEYYRTISDNGKFLYSCGFTTSSNNISTSGSYQSILSANYDCIISKFDTSGKLIWSTYYGGTGLDQARAIAIDNSGDLFIVGNSSSSTGMTTLGAFQTTLTGSSNGLIAKFSDSGKRIWSTYYGGSGTDEFYGTCTDNLGNIYAVGRTSSSSGIATTGVHSTTYRGGEDGLMVKMSGTGSRIWGTYMGGTSQDYLQSIFVSPTYSIYTNGYTLSSSQISLNAVYQSSYGGSGDAFIAKFDANAKLEWSNYFGGSGLDVLHTLASDGNKSIYLAGYTSSTSNIASSGSFQASYTGGTDATIVNFDTLGNKVWATYYGGSGYDEAYQINFKDSYLMIGGRTNSSSGIATGKALKTFYTAGTDIFIARFNPNGNRIWATYYGGTGDDILIGCYMLGNNCYISGNTNSSNSIATSGSHQSVFGGSKDAFLVKFEFSPCDDYAISLSSEFITPKCYRDSNGMAIVKVNNAKEPINYFWKTTPTQNKDTAFGLKKGTYEVIVTDSLGCKDSIKITVQEPDKLKAFVRDSIHISCAGQKDGKLIAGYAGGTSPVTYSWNTSPIQNYDTAIGLIKGLYKVKITDANGCLDSAIANIIEPDTLTSKITGFKNASCFLLNDGQIDVTAFGGTLPYNYSWSTSPIQTTSSAYNIKAGYYEVLIKDKNGCATKSGFTISEPSPVTIGVTNKEDCTCFNDSNGQIFTKVWGGTPGYKISWNTNPVSSDLNLKKLNGGNYRLTVTDTLNCTTTKNITISEPPPIILKFDSITDVLCKNGNTGSVYLQIAGGSPSYSIFWNTAPLNNKNKLSNLNAGIYSVTVKDSMSCRIIDSIKINEPDSILITGISKDVQCNGNNTGEVKTNANGGVSPYKFIWSHDSTINKPNINQLHAGNYLLSIKDKNNCESSKQFIINEPAKIEINQQLVKPIACYNGQDGRLSVSINGGVPPLKLIWNTTPERYSLSIDSLKAGFYTATVVDSFGCADSLSIRINEPRQLVGYFDSIVSPSCYKKLDGSSTYKVVGGTRPYIYSFDNAPFQNDSLAYKVGAGFVKVKIIDAKGCVLLDSNELFHPAELKAQAQIENISCFGLSDGRIILGTEGGVKPYKYLWSNGIRDTSTASGLSRAYYYLTILDKNNCTIKDTFSITEPDKLLAQIDVTLPATCYNGSDGLASGKAIGGTKPYDFFWTGLSNQNSQVAKNLRAGAYKLYVKDANGCLDSAFTQIGRPDKIRAIISSSKKPTCEFGSDGEAIATALPGVGPYNYLWSDGSNLAKAEGLKKGNYSVIITDACGDTAMAQVQIEDPSPFIIPNVSGYIIAKKGTIENYSIVNNLNWTYEWSIENGSIISGQGTNSISIKWNSEEKGTITIKVTNELGCVDDNDLSISLFDECMLVFPNPTANETSVFIPYYIQGKNLELFDTKGSKVYSEPAQKINKVDVSHLTAGIYIFRYENCKIKLLKN